ncbi:hypothetical protein X275_00700 [Marinitoga sp. 1197]|uniref:PQQ-binding-like beta-propeller repeat protein n=1 Tax=Marinitoga sp. 1197 TaxID=1428449 RepID=UPI00065A1C26|nr:PQQ-binding-like beta-propeller repeat protein [Marinitoga sp. 1197]KLO24236.1 hypothetical protein X275_00700 [Marinitoga sp. 1197]
MKKFYFLILLLAFILLFFSGCILTREVPKPDPGKDIYIILDGSENEITVKLNWKVDTQEPLKYMVYFGKNPDKMDKIAEIEKIAEFTYKFKYTPTIKTYYWKVVAVNAAGKRAISDIRRIYIILKPEAKINIKSEVTETSTKNEYILRENDLKYSIELTPKDERLSNYEYEYEYREKIIYEGETISEATKIVNDIFEFENIIEDKGLGKYEIKVFPYYKNKTTNETIDGKEIHVIVNRDNYFPEITEINHIVTGEKAIKLQWDATDKDGDELEYEIWLNKETEESTRIATQTQKELEIKDLDIEQTYNVKIIAKDEKGGIGEGIYSFKLENEAPELEIDTMESTTNVAVNKDITIEATVVDYYIPLGNTFGFTVKLTNITENTEEEIMNISEEGSEINKTYEIIIDSEKLKAENKYRIDITASDGIKTSQKSLEFETTHNPEITEINHIVTGEKAIKLQWDATDKDGDDLVYEIWLNKETEESTRIATQTQKELEIKDLDIEQTYNVKIIAKDEKGGIGEGIYSFKLAGDLAENTAPELEISTMESTTNVAVNKDITIEATVVDYYIPEGNVFGFTVKLTNITENTEEEIMNISEEGSEINKTYEIIIDSEKIKAENKYRIDIEATDEMETTKKSIEFETTHNPEITEINHIVTGEKAIKLQWDATDKDGDDLVYEIWLNKETEESTRIVTQTQKDLEIKDLDIEQTYNVKIIAKDEKGGIGEGIYSFKLAGDLAENTAPELEISTMESTTNVAVNKDITIEATVVDYYIPEGNVFGFTVKLTNITENIEEEIMNISEEGSEINKTYEIIIDSEKLKAENKYRIDIEATDEMETTKKSIEFETTHNPEIEMISNIPQNNVAINESYEGTITIKDIDGDEISIEGTITGISDGPTELINKKGIISVDGTQIKYELPKITVNEDYKIEIVVSDNVGGFNMIEYTFTTTHNPTITSLEIEQIDDDTLKIKWDASDEDNDEIKYDLIIYKEGEEFDSVKALTTNEYNLEAQLFKTYKFKLKAYDDKGGEIIKESEEISAHPVINKGEIKTYKDEEYIYIYANLNSPQGIEFEISVENELLTDDDLSRIEIPQSIQERLKMNAIKKIVYGKIIVSFVFEDNMEINEEKLLAINMDGFDLDEVNVNYNILTISLSLEWKFETDDWVTSSPAIGVDGTIYVGNRGGNIYVIKADGTLKRKYESIYLGISSLAIGIDGSVYFGSGWYIRAINPDGSLKWNFKTAGGLVLSSPAIGADGTIYVGSDDHYLYAINPDGSLKWKFKTEGKIFSSPAIGADGTIYVGSDDNYLYAINPDGSLKWKFETNGSFGLSSPAIGADGTIYVGSDDNYLYAINPDESLKWKFETGGDVESSPAIGADGTIYVGSDDHYLYAINPDGSLKWKFETGGDVESSPAIGADGTVYVGSDDHYLYAINPDGSLKWKFETGGDVEFSPAIGADGTVYIGSKDGHIYAINDNNGGLADTSWPMFHANSQHTGRVDEDNYLTSEIILNEDFENIDLGKIPEEFHVRYSGRSYGVVQDENMDDSGNKFLKVWGKPYWGCDIEYYFDIFNYQKIEFNYRIYASDTNKIHRGGVSFINPDVSWGWGCGGANIWDNGNIRFVTNKNEEIKVKVYNINSWNKVKAILFPNEKYGKVYINGKLIYEQWINDDGYSSIIKVYLPDNKTIEYTVTPKSEYQDPNAYKGLKGIRIGDGADSTGDNDIPTYFDDFVIIGYK